MSPKRRDRVPPPAVGDEWEVRFGDKKGNLSTRQFGGRVLEQWQIKVSGSGRIWYLPDDEERKVWVVYASMAHPKHTE